jgi:hypothetical protein
LSAVCFFSFYSLSNFCAKANTYFCAGCVHNASGHGGG